MFILPASPLLSNPLAVLTVSPYISYAFFFPTIPNTNGPECIPIRISNIGFQFRLRSAMCFFTKLTISMAALTTSEACV